ncbi:putative copia-type protein [Trifolium pratense]|uniref:Putative copia-type protein n=1 Tax=Trifolium pratense TaxID=57577 RepID=A0A2K3NQW9_TRIPR|nr:putative copia-type protein [Trifolium pratense]
MENCNKVSSPIVPGCKLVKDENGKVIDAKEFQQMVGSLMYLLATRPDLAYSICLVARYMDRPTELHVAAIKRILRYLKGTLTDGILYKNETGKLLELVGSISWSSKKQVIKLNL